MPITKEEVLEKMKDKDVVILDVLPLANYEKLHIQGSYSLPIVGVRPEAFIQAVAAKFGKNKFFITYCTGFPCRHFQEAADALVKDGFQAEGYAGGLEEWMGSNLPVEGSQTSGA